MNEKKYYAVMYLNGGNAVVSHGYESEDEVREAMGKFITNHPGEVKATTYMVRENEDLMSIFGHPRSRDLMQDKRFLQSITI